MLRTKFIPTVLVIVLGVNLGAWTLSIATSSSHSTPLLSIPVGAPAINKQSQAASIATTKSILSTAANHSRSAVMATTTTPMATDTTSLLAQ